MLVSGFLFYGFVFYQCLLLCGNALGAQMDDGILVHFGKRVRPARIDDKERIVLAPASSKLRCFAKCARDHHCSQSVRYNDDGAMEEVVKEVRNDWHPHADDYVLKCVNAKGETSTDRHLLQQHVNEIPPPSKQDINTSLPTKQDIQKSPPMKRDIQNSPPSKQDIQKYPRMEKDIRQYPPTKQDIDTSPSFEHGTYKSPETKHNTDQSPPSKRDIDQSPPNKEDINQSPPTKMGIDQPPPTKKDIDNSSLTEQDIDKSPSIIQNTDTFASSRKDDDVSAPHTQVSRPSNKEQKTHGSRSKRAKARKTMTSNEIPSTDIPIVLSEEGAVSVKYRVVTETGNTIESSTDSYVYLTLHGVNGTDDLYLSHAGVEMGVGYVDTFHINSKKDVGLITKMEIRLEKYMFIGLPWFCVRLEVERQSRCTNYTKVDVYSSSLNRWFPEAKQKLRFPFHTPQSIPFNLTKTLYKT